MSSLDPASGRALPRPAKLAAAAIGRRWGLPPATAEVRVLRDLAVPMRVGTVLRAEHPRYARNLGTGEPAGQATHGDPVTHRIGHSAVSASSITLPVG